MSNSKAYHAAGKVIKKQLRDYDVLLVVVDHAAWPFRNIRDGLKNYLISNMKYYSSIKEGDVVSGTVFEHGKRDSKGNRQYRFHVDSIVTKTPIRA